MLELFGLPLGTPFQGGTLVVVLAIFGLVVRVWIVGIPERLRAGNEVKVAAAAELAARFKAWRKEVHDLKNELMVVAGAQAKCNKALSSSTTLNEQLMFLIELMIAELEILDPKSKTVARARTMFKRISTTLGDPKKSDTLNAADMAVADTKQALTSAKETRDEVKAAENKGNGQ